MNNIILLVNETKFLLPIIVLLGLSIIVSLVAKTLKLGFVPTFVIDIIIGIALKQIFFNETYINEYGSMTEIMYTIGFILIMFISGFDNNVFSKDIILNSEKHKRWIYSPVSQEWLVQAKSYYKNKIEEYSKRTVVKTQRTYESTSYTKRNNYKESYHSYSQKERISEENYPFYLEIKDRFNENHEQIIDSRGKRWLKCDYCGDKLLYGAFSKFNVDGNPNLGFCTMCCHRYKLFG